VSGSGERAYIHIYYVYIYIHIIYIYIYTCIHTYIHAYMCACMYLSIVCCCVCYCLRVSMFFHVLISPEGGLEEVPGAVFEAARREGKATAETPTQRKQLCFGGGGAGAGASAGGVVVACQELVHLRISAHQDMLQLQPPWRRHCLGASARRYEFGQRNAGGRWHSFFCFTIQNHANAV